MKLKVLGSSSAGNCYILEGEHSALIIELGVNFREVKKAFGFNYQKIAGALVSHEHMDHCKAVSDAVAVGINIYCSAGTKEAMNIPSLRIKELDIKKSTQIGDFMVRPFDVRHDCEDPFGFIINHKECGKVLFVTDTIYIPYNFPGLNNIIIEANYCKEIVDSRLISGDTQKMVRDRVIKSHMSIQTCKEVLVSNDLSAVNNIVLIHLSDGNSNAKDFKKQVQELTGKNVHVAEAGMEILFNKTPF